MKKNVLILTAAVMGLILCTSCRNSADKKTVTDEFIYPVDRFEDISVLKYRLPAFEQLSLQEKEFIYYLSEAALCGRDILWDQNFKYNLIIRKTIEAIISSYSGDRETAEFKAFLTYARRVFFCQRHTPSLFK